MAANLMCYYKFSFGEWTGVSPWDSNANIQTYHTSRLQAIADMGFSAVKATPRSVTKNDATVAEWFADQCNTLGLELWYHVINGVGAQIDPFDTAGIYNTFYNKTALTRCLFKDEPSSTTDPKIADINTQQTQARTHYNDTIFTMGTAFIGEEMVPGDDVTQDMIDAITQGDFWLARHYPIRRTHGLDHHYRDKYKLNFEDWVREVRRRSTVWEAAGGDEAVPIVQAFGGPLSSDPVTRDWDSFWRLPTKDELLAMLQICDNSSIGGFDWIGVFGAGDDGGTYLPFIDNNLIEARAYDGSRPADAIREFTSTTNPSIGTFAASDATPDVSEYDVWQTDTGTLTITDLDGFPAGEERTIISKGAVTFDTTVTNLVGSSVDIVTADGDVTKWVCEDGTTKRLIQFTDVSADNSGGT